MSRRDGAIHRQIVQPLPAAALARNLNLPRPAVGFVNESLGFERAQMSRYTVGAAYSKRPLNFRDGGRAAVLAPERHNIVENRTLLGGEHHGISIYTATMTCQGAEKET